MAHTGNFSFAKEDHTLGNLLRMQLLRDPRVVYVGYAMRHPREPVCSLKVSTTGEMTPIDAVRDAVKALVVEVMHLRERVDQAVVAASAGRITRMR
jgi:DNA-directed RNA polymerase II subunit RPB11